MLGADSCRQQGTSITKGDLERLLELEPRRHRLIDLSWHNVSWVALQAPFDERTDWCLNFPFFETFCPAFDEFRASREGSAEIERLPFERQDGSRCKYTYLKNADDSQLSEVGEWVSIISRFVAIRDFLRVSFALDYTCERGDPGQGLTDIARARQAAKLYGSSDSPTADTRVAASRLAEGCITFIRSSKAYHRADTVLAVPRSDPSKAYSLPESIANQMAEELHLTDLSASARTVKARREMKDTRAEERLLELEGTIEVDSDAVKGRRILIVDDLYQSGTTMNYMGMLLLENGASCVYGLACEKTCSNQD